MIGDSYCLEFCSMMQREVNTPLFHSSLNSLCVALPSNIGSISDFTQSSRVQLPVLFTNMQKQQFSCTMCWSTSECYWICCTSNYGIQTSILSTTDNLHCVASLSNMRFGAAYLIQFWSSRKKSFSDLSKPKSRPCLDRTRGIWNVVNIYNVLKNHTVFF